MNVVVTSAPGKVVLCGEYAVLAGAPAVCMAVNRRARVTVADFSGDWHRVSAPGYTSVEGRFVADGRALDWLQGEREYRLVDAVWWGGGCDAPVGRDDRHLSIELDTAAFVDAASGNKIGLGSSAALTVALLAALRQSVNVLGPALQSHKEFQQGAGSGVDIAAAVTGGLIEYRAENAVIIERQWPSGLASRLLWTGVPCSTQTQIERLRKSGACSPGALIAAAETMATAWHSAAGVMQQYPAYIDALRRFSVDHDLGIFDAGHERLVTEAAAAGLVYKPCGAGGGDVGILLGTDDEELDSFIRSMAIVAGRALDCALETEGVALHKC